MVRRSDRENGYRPLAASCAIPRQVISALCVTTREAKTLKLPEMTRHPRTFVAEGGHECPQKAVGVNELLRSTEGNAGKNACEQTVNCPNSRRQSNTTPGDAQIQLLPVEHQEPFVGPRDLDETCGGRGLYLSRLQMEAVRVMLRRQSPVGGDDRLP